MAGLFAHQFPRAMAPTLGLTIATLTILSFADGTRAAPTEKQRQAVIAMLTDVRKAGQLYEAGKFAESGKLIGTVQAQLEEMLPQGKADPEVMVGLERVHRSLTRAHALLELEGVPLRALKPLEAQPAPTPAPAAPVNQVSFVKQVAPLLNAKCGRCHVSGNRGMFAMPHYAALMKGPAAGLVVFKGDAAGSRLIEVIESGDMPRGGQKLSAQELGMLKQWINEGAKFDGTDPTQSLAALAPATNNEQAPVVPLMAATGKETVSFARDIAPVLVASCTGCHGEGRRPGGQFNAATFAALLRGGDSGAPLVPGKPSESLLIKKLRGTAGERMPLRAPALPEATIAKFEKWIEEGASYDGGDPQVTVRRVADLARTKSATHEQLSQERIERAAQNWRVGMPGIAQQTATTTNFYVIGNLGENTLAQIGELAEQTAPRVAEVLQAPADQSLIKGRMTLYLFRQRYDYSEFGKMVEKRKLPAQWRGHWRYDVVDAYGAMITPRNEEYSLASVVAHQLAGAYVASLGDSVPHWFAEGVGRVAASRLEPEDPRVTQWDEGLGEVFAAMKAPGDFLLGKLAPEQNDLAAYSFAKFLMKDKRRFQALLAALRQGTEFDAAFTQVYRVAPVQLTANWLTSAARKR